MAKNSKKEIQLRINGLRQAQEANQKAVQALSPSGGVGRMLQKMVLSMHASAVKESPFDTGSLAASHRIDLKRNATSGRIHISPTARNSKSNELVSRYAKHVHDLGGKWAFYDNVESRYAPQILEAGLRILQRELP